MIPLVLFSYVAFGWIHVMFWRERERKKKMLVAGSWLIKKWLRKSSITLLAGRHWIGILDE
jgi:hypothetical protein